MNGNQNAGECKEIEVSKPMKVFMVKLIELPMSGCKTAWKIGREDHKRVIHALKVGLALTLVSLLYLLEPLFDGFGQNAMWAVMTVVVVLEYTAGATLRKGLNRGLGTVCAGLLALFMEEVAENSGKVFRAVFIGVSVFAIGSLATYLRFFPSINRSYDYGVVVFLLTFNLIMVSSYRVENILGLARDRLYTIAIGCTICLIMTLVILPNWSGEDLHKRTVDKLEGLAISIEACVKKYFKSVNCEDTGYDASDDLIDKGYRAVLDSKSNDETLAQYARWEPRYTRNFHIYPWQQYVKLGAVLRHFGYAAIALRGCLDSQIQVFNGDEDPNNEDNPFCLLQAPRSFRTFFQNPCERVAREVSNVLAELAHSIKDRRGFSPDRLRARLNAALRDLNFAIKSQPEVINKETTDKRTEKDPSVLTPDKIAMTSLQFPDALPFTAFSSLLVEMVARLDLVIGEVDKLGKVANFKEFLWEDCITIDFVRNSKGHDKNDWELQNSHVPSEATE